MMELVNQVWYSDHPLGTVLAPLSWMYEFASRLRRLAYRRGVLPVVQLPVPVVVVGNITVGGTGKTPIVIALARYLTEHGYVPGIATRGYRGQAHTWPQAVTVASDPRQVGDEPVVLARRSGCPVVAGPDRVETARKLLDAGVNVILCDDGLQHYRLARTIEIAVVDGERRHGNKRCLPAGPLREPPSRLRAVDFVLTTGQASSGEIPVRMHLKQPTSLVQPESQRAWSDFVATRIHAIAGIGHPQRFFSDLEAKGLVVQKHPFPDHHDYSLNDVDFPDALPVLMTEKDAVKCTAFASDRLWYVPLDVHLPESFGPRLLELLKVKSYGQEVA